MKEKKYLSHFLKDINLESNSLIIAPTGSGKTHYIFNELLKEGRHLYLCDTENLKTFIEEEDNTFSNRKSIEGFSNKNVEIMCYKELGKKLRFNNDIINEYQTIVCDEIHNLIDYQGFNDDTDLSHAIKELFKEYDNTKILYFTATPEYLNLLVEKNSIKEDLLNVIDFSKNKEIKRYINRRVGEINNLTQIKPSLKEYEESFEYGGLKCLIFSQQINSMKKIEKMCEDINLKPICIWSRNNQAHKMDPEQLKVRNYLIKYGELLDPYNVLIINRSSETGLNITDKKMDLAIVNTVNLTQQIQVRGRIRHDIDLLVVRTKNQNLPKMKITLDDKYLDKEFTKEEIEDIIIELNIRNKKNQYITVNKFRNLIENSPNSYSTKTVKRKSNYIRTTYYIISEGN